MLSGKFYLILIGVIYISLLNSSTINFIFIEGKVAVN